MINKMSWDYVYRLPGEWCIVISGRSCRVAGLWSWRLWSGSVIVVTGAGCWCIKARGRWWRHQVISVRRRDDSCGMNSTSGTTATHWPSQPLTDTHTHTYRVTVETERLQLLTESIVGRYLHRFNLQSNIQLTFSTDYTIYKLKLSFHNEWVYTMAWS